MAFCTKCGAQMSDDTNFCPVCGTQRVGTASAPTPVAPAVPKKRVSNVPFATRMRQFILKNNTLFLIGLVCMALGTLLSFVSNLSSGGFNTFTAISLIVSAVPVVAILLLWLEAPKTTPFSEIGLLIIKYASIVSMALAGIAAVISVVGMELIVDMASSVNLEISGKAQGIITVVFLIIFALIAGYQALIMLHANKLLKALKTNETPDASGALVTILWIVAGFCVLSALLSLTSGAMTLLSNLASAGSSVSFALLATKAKKELAQ